MSPLRVFGIVLACYALTAGGHLYSPDEEILFRTTRALATRASLAIEPLEGFATRPASPPRPDGREYGQYGIGQPILAIPFYYAGALLSHVGSDETWARIYGHPMPGGAAEIAPRWAVSWFNIFAGAALAALICAVGNALFGGGGAPAALMFALGTMIWPHSRQFFSEIAAVTCLLGSWLLLAHLDKPSPSIRRPRQTVFLAGAAAAYAVLVRMDSLFAVPGLALFVLAVGLGGGRRAGRTDGPFPFCVMFCVPLALAGLLLIVLNQIHFGGALESGYADQPEGISFDTPPLLGLYALLFSAGKGLIFFSPVLILNLWAWPAAATQLQWLDDEAQGGGAPVLRSRLVLGALALSILVPLILHAMWRNAGGWDWGPRHIVIIQPFLALPVAALFARAKDHPFPAVGRIGIAVVCIVGVAVQLLGCSQDPIQFHSRFFRSPGDSSAYFVEYDGYDRQYWSAYYQLMYRGPGGADPRAEAGLRPVPLYPPAPLSDSLYMPTHTVWTGYPQMFREGSFDNFWIRWLRGSAGPSHAGAAAL